MSTLPPAPVYECLHGTVDGLEALIWKRNDGGAGPTPETSTPSALIPTLWWCWLSSNGELLRTETHYVGWLNHSDGHVSNLTWRRLNPVMRVVLVNQRLYPWDSADERYPYRRGGGEMAGAPSIPSFPTPSPLPPSSSSL